MVNKRYEAKENVPTDIRSVPAAEDVLTFAVPTEAYHGYGSAKYVYPTEQIEHVSDLLVTDGEPARMTAMGEVRLYTVPHDALRWARHRIRGSHATRAVRKLMVNYQAAHTTTYQGGDQTADGKFTQRRVGERVGSRPDRERRLLSSLPPRRVKRYATGIG